MANTQDGSLDVCVFFYSCCILYVDVLLMHLLPFFFRVGVAYKQPLLYNLAVTREVIKQIYIREGLQPPSFSTIRSAYASLWSQFNTPGLVRNLTHSPEVGRIAVYGLQAYGIFKVRFVSCFFFFCGIQ